MINQPAHFSSTIASQFIPASLRLVFQSGNKAFAAPKLNGAAIRKPFGFADCIVVVSAN